MEEAGVFIIFSTCVIPLVVSVIKGRRARLRIEERKWWRSLICEPLPYSSANAASALFLSKSSLCLPLRLPHRGRSLTNSHAAESGGGEPDK